MFSVGGCWLECDVDVLEEVEDGGSHVGACRRVQTCSHRRLRQVPRTQGGRARERPPTELPGGGKRGTVQRCLPLLHLHRCLAPGFQAERKMPRRTAKPSSSSCCSHQPGGSRQIQSPPSPPSPPSSCQSHLRPPQASLELCVQEDQQLLPFRTPLMVLFVI